MKSAFGSRLSRLALCSLIVSVLAPIAARGDNISVGWTGSCPPNGYSYTDAKGVFHKVAQPPFNFDLGNTGKFNSWLSPVTLTKVGDGQIPATDAQGNKIFLPCIPDPKGPGLGADYFSPRIMTKGGPAAGVAIGQCVYECGRNSWMLCSTFNNNPKVADQFTKSIWESRDGGTAANDWKFSGKITQFVTDLTKQQIVPVRTTMTMTPGPGGGISYSIQDAKVVPEGTTLSNVILAGSPIGLPQPMTLTATSPPPPPSQFEAPNLCINTLNDLTSNTQPGRLVTITGSVTNEGDTSHTYNFSLFGVGATIESSVAPLIVAPGQTEPYSFLAKIDSTGFDAVVSYAFDETGNPQDNCVNADVIASVPEPATILLLGIGVACAAGWYRLRGVRSGPTSRP